jgi:hypothetical protein
MPRLIPLSGRLSVAFLTIVGSQHRPATTILVESHLRGLEPVADRAMVAGRWRKTTSSTAPRQSSRSVRSPKADIASAKISEPADLWYRACGQADLVVYLRIIVAGFVQGLWPPIAGLQVFELAAPETASSAPTQGL